MPTPAELARQRREELDALVAQHGGTITPAQVVAFAADPATALHTVFCWDDTEAARRFREVQAAQYLRAVVRFVPRPNDEPVAVRAYVHLSSDRGEHLYRPVVSVLDDDAQRAQLVADAMRELHAFRAKYQHLSELAGVFDALASLDLAPAA